MRIASLTFDGYVNYGNLLQKYALQHTLKKFADFTEVLWDAPTKFILDTGKIDFLLKPIPPNTDSLKNQKYFLYEVVRTTKLKEFENRYIKTRFNLPYLEEIANDYDFFVVGSDQVWNPGMTLPKYFLNFAPRKKRIAYATSIAAPAIPNNMKEILKREISGFDYISVREEKSVEIIKELTGQDAVLLLDPTMTLTPEEWLEIAQKPSWLKEKYERGYILTYYLRNEPPPLIKELAKHLNLPLINLLDWDNYWHYITSPEEFVYLFSKASLIFTNSFHGCIFSILFRRPFMNAEVDYYKNMSTRIPGLLKMFGLEDKIMSIKKSYRPESFFEIDYSTRDRILPLERGKAFKFLSSALGVLPKSKTGGR